LTRNGTDCAGYQDLTNWIDYKGLQATLGSWVYATIANRGAIEIQDGTSTSSSSYHNGDSTWHWITVTGSISAVATQVRLRCRLENGNTSVYYDGMKLTLGSTCTPDTYPPVSIAFTGSVPNNNNPYVLMSDSVPYLNYYKHYVNGILVGWYQPNDIILGTVMPDRATGDGVQNAAITWGSNPAGVGATVSSMSSSGQPSIGSTTGTSTKDILPPVGGTDWRPVPGVSAQLLANPMRPIVTAISDNTTLSEYQVWVWLGILFVVLVFALVAPAVRGHHLITGIAVSAAIILLVVWTVFPWWTLSVDVLAIWRGLVSERSPTL
jgi:hypothetical protein